MRWVVGGLSVLGVLVVLAVGALVLIPSDRIARLATDEFRTLTGRELTLSGGVRPTLWPVLGVKTGEISLANAPWSKNGPMLTADGLSIGLDMAALIGGDIRVTEVDLIAPRILLERDAKGTGNWQFAQTGGQPATEAAKTIPGAGRPFTLDQARITNGTVTYVDATSGQRLEVTDIAVETAVPDFNGAAQITVTAAMHGQPLQLSGTVAQFSRLIEGKLTPLSAVLTTGQTRIALDGRGGLAPAMAEGALTADLTDIAALARLAGTVAPALPQGFGATKLGLTGKLTLTEAGSAHLRAMEVLTETHTFTGDADLTTDGPRPKLAAKLATSALVLPKSQGTAPDAASGTGWPKDFIDASALSLMDADIALSAQSIDLGRAKLGPTRARVTVDRARAVFALREAQAYGGNVTGQFVLNNRGSLSVGGDLRLAGMSMQPLLTDLVRYDRLIGKGTVTVKFLGVGSSVDAIMRSLSGEARLLFGKGEIKGLDIAGMLRTLDPNHVGEGAKTIFDSLSIGFAIADGIASSTDLALKAPMFSATGAGKLDLGGQSIDYRVLPAALPGTFGTAGITVPVLIRGPWAKPQIKLDLEWMAQQKVDAEKARLEARLAEEKAKLEAEARARLTEEAAQELGVIPREGETLQDAARRRTQDALEAEAARVLRGLLEQD